jgi:diamine N-acetyltransferase
MPATVKLVDVTSENWHAVIRLKVHPQQENFVASNLYSLAEARIFPECVPLAIFSGDTLVGFIMYTSGDKDGEVWILRLMIDAAFQGKGYGRAAMQLLLHRLRALPGCRRVFLSYEPDNTNAERLYDNLGFQPTGEMEEDEKVACLKWEMGEE